MTFRSSIYISRNIFKQNSIVLSCLVSFPTAHCLWRFDLHIEFLFQAFENGLHYAKYGFWQSNKTLRKKKSTSTVKSMYSPSICKGFHQRWITSKL